MDKNFRSVAIAMIATGTVLCAALTSAHAAPVVFCKDGPGIDLVGDGCVSGTGSAYPGGGDGIYSNTGGGDPELKVEQAIFQATGDLVDLVLYGSSDDNASLFAFNPVDPTVTQSGTWTVLDGTLISYITIKGANSFALYELGTPAATGTYTTLGLLNNGGQQPDVSHIRFWTSVTPTQTDVPEPMTGGLVLLGAALAVRNRRARK